MNDRKISVDDVVRIFVDQAKKEERLYIRAELIQDFTKMNDEEIVKWFKEYGLVMDNGLLNTDIMQEIDPEAKVGETEFNLPKKEDVESAYDSFMQRVEDSVTDYDYMDDENWDGMIGNPNERFESKKYSSFKNQQTITENFRRFLKK